MKDVYGSWPRYTGGNVSIPLCQFHWYFTKEMTCSEQSGVVQWLHVVGKYNTPYASSWIRWIKLGE